MNKSIILKRPVAVHGWRVIGRIAKTVRREELEPILLRARETNGTDEKDIAEHLLFSLSRKVVAKRLLHIGKALNILEEIRENRERRFVLTEDGEKAIKTGKVFVPEQGAWTVWASDDPLLSSPILRIESWQEPRAFDETRNGREKRSFDKLPLWIREAGGTEITPPAARNGIAIRIDDLEEKAEEVASNGSLNLIWNVHECRLRLRGRLNGKEVDAELEAPKETSDEIWDVLLKGKGLLEDWDMARQELQVPFDDTTEPERESMRRSLEFKRPSVPNYGVFDPLTVSGVPIVANSHDDAQAWSKWRLDKRIRDYASSQRYADWCREAVAPFDQYRLELPARAELAESAWGAAGRPKPRAWHLIATEDWRL